LQIATVDLFLDHVSSVYKGVLKLYGYLDVIASLLNHAACVLYVLSVIFYSMLRLSDYFLKIEIHHAFEQLRKAEYFSIHQ